MGGEIDGGGRLVPSAIEQVVEARAAGGALQPIDAGEAAAVTMFVAPGPIDEVTAMSRLRLLAFA